MGLNTKFSPNAHRCTLGPDLKTTVIGRHPTDLYWVAVVSAKQVRSWKQGLVVSLVSVRDLSEDGLTLGFYLGGVLPDWVQRKIP